MTRRLLGWLFLPLCAMACSVDTGIQRPPPDATDTDDVVPPAANRIAAFQSSYVDAACGWFVRCADDVAFFDDLDSCKSILALTFSAGFSDSGGSVQPELFRLDEQQAAACLTTVETTSCASPAPLYADVAACAGAVVGRLADGECCDERGGCAPGSVCERTSFGSAGYCSARGDAGETCAEQTCAAPATCEAVDNSGIRQCVLSLALGVGENCEHTYDCAPTLSCQTPVTGGRPECLARASVGDFCRSPELPCAAGLYCIGTGSDFRCASTPGVAGQSCQTTADCGASLFCEAGSEPDATCVHRGAMGDACAEQPGQQCASGLACVASVCSVIPVPVAYGDPCTPDGPPCPGLFSSNDTCRDMGNGYICVAPAEENEACGGDGDAECNFGRGLACYPDTSTCRRVPRRGEACPDGFCFPQFTVACVDGQCVDRKPVGSACTPFANELDELFDTECALFAQCMASPSGGTVCTSLIDDESGGSQCN